tara:strand:+ start:598 stop:804 length:207 start_codon:yes stop_codon:yes gene_type:complete
MGGNSMNMTTRTPNPYAMDDHGSAVDLGRQRMIQAKIKYQQLKKQSYEVPLNKEKASIPKWLDQKLKD